MNPILWSVFIVYIALLGYTIAYHELWGDELHSWNIAKASGSFGDLLYNTKYEGHPPVWYTILWIVSKFTHNVVYVQIVHGAIAALTVFIVLFYSPFSLLTRLLIPFGYYFLYEYAVLSRNYAIAVLLVLCICLLMQRNSKYKFPLYYLLLFLMANTHLLAMVLAAGVHLYFLLVEYEKRRGKLAWHAVAGLIIFLSALYFIFPPADSELSTAFWLNKWTIHQVKAIIQMPLRAFMPIPAWWLDNFWNTEFLIEAKDKYAVLKFINSLIALLLIGAAFFVLRQNKKGLMLFAANTLLTFALVATLFAFATARYSGFVFIGFLVAYWFTCRQPRQRPNASLINILLAAQLVGGLFICLKDIKRPFSNAYRVTELLREVPPNEKAVTDYWTLNIISAFADKPFYCVDVGKEMSFIAWGSDIARMQKKANRYYDGIRQFFQRHGVQKLYLISTQASANLYKLDPKLSTMKVVLVDSREGAIEKTSDLYLYEISSY